MDENKKSSETNPYILSFCYDAAESEKIKESLEVIRIILETNGHMNGSDPSWDWRIAQNLASTRMVTIEEDFDVDVSTGEDGKPVYEGGSFPVGVTINDSDTLLLLRQYLEDKISDAETASDTAFAGGTKVKWRCPECGYFIMAFEKKEDLEKLLLQNPASRACKKCRSRSWPSMKEGRMVILKIEKDIEDEM